MNYDITFCSKTDCNQECERNQKNVDKKEVMIRHGIYIGDMPNCEYFDEENK